MPKLWIESLVKLSITHLCDRFVNDFANMHMFEDVRASLSATP